MTTTSTSSKSSRKAPQQQQQEPPPLVLANGIPPVLDAMKRAAVVFKIPVPAGSSEAAQRELVGALRLKMKELLAPVPKASQLVCQKCGERSTEDTEYCPFCGDLGIGEADTQGAGISNAPGAEPTQDVDGKLSNLAGELTEKLERISALKLSVVDSSYDMGVLIKEIHDRQLWKVKGYLNFKLFAERELPFSRSTAYQLVQVVERFDKKTYLEVGFRKLRTIAAVDDEGTREQLLADAKSGASTREIDEKTRPASSKKNGKKDSGKVEAAGDKRAEAPPSEERVTVLGRIDGKPKEAKFKSAKDGKRISSAGKVTMFVADAYAEVEITEDVYLRVGLRVSGKDIIGLSTEFVRAS
jgi:hypothetical protein